MKPRVGNVDILIFVSFRRWKRRFFSEKSGNTGKMKMEPEYLQEGDRGGGQAGKEPLQMTRDVNRYLGEIGTHDTRSFFQSQGLCRCLLVSR